MTPNEYQQLAMRTKADPVKILARLNELGPDYVQAWLATNGLTNECGETADIIKGAIEYGKGLIDETHLKEEIGDALWRLAQLADAFDLTLEGCMRANIAKLAERYPDEFTDYLANNRDLEKERQALERPIRRGGPYDHLLNEALFKEAGIPSKSVSFTECNEAGFIEPPADDLEKSHSLKPHDPGMPDPPIPGGYTGGQSPIYPRDENGVIQNTGWSFGMPTEPGDYEWFSPRYSLDPSKITVHRNYSGKVETWGRDVYYRKIKSEIKSTRQ